MYLLLCLYIYTHNHYYMFILSQININNQIYKYEKYHPTYRYFYTMTVMSIPRHSHTHTHTHTHTSSHLYYVILTDDITTQYYGSANAVSNAKRMGIKVIHIDTASTYVNNELRKLEKQRKTVCLSHITVLYRCHPIYNSLHSVVCYSLSLSTLC